MPDAILATEGLYKRFGGLTVTDRVSLTVAENELHAIIGPNGAGKTTLLEQLSGRLQPDAGIIRLAGDDVTLLSAQARASRGLGRSFQITSIFSEFTVTENVALAIQVREGHSFRFWQKISRDKSMQQRARAVIDRIGLAARAELPAARLAHGEKRALELGIALAMQPRVLLLDEPLAGMGSEESIRMTQLLATLKGTTTIVLIEHDMDVVFNLADRISVLVYGRIIACGAPGAIRSNNDVRRSYLGDEADD
ncbi:ABC transporter ATP-binding protein [Bradyrhizobium sp.]|jgi:branched-chain amino acid transport system ATP-binding protein|uniref:ABC transporter ATP-binding protein n=1 Tax=Bradyrhizobium sp. TaxID=376 RepID=UPI003C25B9A5